MTDNRALAIPERQSEGLLTQIVLAAKDPTVDADKMQAMANLAISLQDRERQIEFNMSKNAAIMEMPVITKDGRIIIRKEGQNDREQGRFSRYEDIDRVCRPVLQRHNLAISFEMNERQGGGITVTPILSHANGMTERGGAFPVPPETSGSKNAAQAMGSSSSYGKRYAYCAILNIVTEGVDDDGSGGRGRNVAAHLPFEREQAVRADAEAAGQAGQYAEWFSKQPPKDRSWLVTSDLHQKYGGQTVLPPPSKPDPVVIDDTPEPEKPKPRPDPEPERREEQQTGRRSPRQWVDGFKAEVDKINNLQDLDEFEDKYRDTLAQLKAHDDKLWKEADDHALKRREDIENGRLV